MDPFIIAPEHPAYYYALFYFLAFLVGFVWLIAEGRKRDFPAISWMMLIATAFLFFMAGCRIVSYSRTEWAYVLRLEPIPYATARSVLGGILFVVPGILLAKKFLSFKSDVLDAFAVVLPVGIFVQRFGCLLAGCCYGRPSDLPWAVHYGGSSTAFAMLVRDGMLGADALLTMPLHPSQLYEILACFLIVLILLWTRNFLHASGNLFWLSIALYGIVRFLLEFVRAPGGHSVGIQEVYGLNFVQWSILVIVPSLAAWIVYRERKFNPKRNTKSQPQTFYGLAFYFAFLCVLFLLISKWLNPVEIISFNTVLLPLLATLTWFLFSRATIPGYRWVSLMLPLPALLLMSQTLPEKSPDNGTRISYNTFSLGTLTGETNGQMLMGYQNSGGGGCSPSGSVPIYNDYSNRYSTFGIQFGRTVQQGPDKFISFGAGGFTGHHSETSPGGTFSKSVYGVSPYFTFDTQGAGIGLGFTTGDFTQIVRVEKGAESSAKELKFYPSLSLRVGELKKVFAEYKLGQLFPAAFPATTHQAYLGFGLGENRRSVLRVGTASNCGFIFGGTFSLGSNVMADLYGGAGGGIGTNLDNSQNGMFLFNLHFKFNKRYRPSPGVPTDKSGQ